MTAIYDGRLILRRTLRSSKGVELQPCCVGMARAYYTDKVSIVTLVADDRLELATISTGRFSHCPWCGARARTVDEDRLMVRGEERCPSSPTGRAGRTAPAVAGSAGRTTSTATSTAKRTTAPSS